MEISGEFHIPANKKTVWDGLNNPEILKNSLPGCEQLEKISDTEFTAVVTTKLGPVKAKFTAKVTLSQLDPPNSYTISGEGQGGAAGFASGSAEVFLKDTDNITTLEYKAQANVGGKIAQIGSRLIDSTAKKLANEFFSKFSELVSIELAQESHDSNEYQETDKPEEKVKQRTNTKSKIKDSNTNFLIPSKIWAPIICAAAIALILGLVL